MKKKLLSILLGAVIAFGVMGLTACGQPSDNGGGTENGQPSDNGGKEEKQYTVSFDTDGGSAVASVTGVEGTAVNVQTPSKKDCFFMGWYSDAGRTTPASVPSTVPSHDVKLYAKWETATQHFLNARDALINANSFEYDFNLSVTTRLGAAGVSVNGPTAVIQGNVKYNQASTTPYLKVENNSGALISDGTVYTYSDGDMLRVIKQNESGKVYDYNESPLDADFKYETSMYAKALFEFDGEAITSVTESGTSGTYNIRYNKSSAGKIVSGAFKVLSSPILEAFLNVNIPDVDNAVECTVSFNGNNVYKYNYGFVATVSGQEARINYELTLKSLDNVGTITAPSFAGLATGGEQLDAQLGNIKTAINGYCLQETSGYNYDVKTKVDYVKSVAIDSHVQGRTMHKREGGVTYFWNRIEVDSDYKNDDLYKNDGIVDYERYRVMLSNGEVYDAEDRVWPLTNKFDLVENYGEEQLAIDQFYFLPSAAFFTAENVSLVQYAESSGEKTYSLGLSNRGVESFLKFLNDGIRLDVTLAKQLDVFNFTEGHVRVTGVSFDITVDASGVLKSIEVKIKGSANGAYTGTNFSGVYNFTASLSITTNDKAAGYTIPEKTKDIALENS